MDRIITRACEFKFAGGDDAPMRFSGYASKFGGTDAYGDTIAPGAYTETLQSDRQVLLKRNHFDGVVGKWTQIKQDDVGLWVEGELTPGHRAAEDTFALLKHGAITGLSIGYVAVDAERKSDGRRLLKQIDLYEISIVDEPADDAARIVAVKDCQSLKDIERLLRQRGFSRSEATAIVAQIKALTHGDHAEAEQAIDHEAIARVAALIKNVNLLRG